MTAAALRSHSRVLILLIFSALSLRAAPALINAPQSLDTDRDGLSDQLEQKLLQQFSPAFMIAQHDCAGTPAEFKSKMQKPEIASENGTIYGQVFPSKPTAGQPLTVEIHFYHLWSRDCGAHGHHLDTEHVSALIRPSGRDLESATWKALYWYAAAHENTVCDVSQIARASTLQAENRGATVWISPGKHASYFSERICQGGCGADHCYQMIPIATANLINLGEIGHPMNGSAFIASIDWPLESKMTGSNFSSESIARLNLMPDSDIAWVNPGKHPVQGVIADSSAVGDAIAESGHNTTGAVSEAGGSTGNALQKSFHNTTHALGKSARSVGRALGAKPRKDPKE